MGSIVHIFYAIHSAGTIQSSPLQMNLCFCMILDVDPKCLRFLSVANECAALPRRSYFLACCLVKTLARQVSEVSQRMQRELVLLYQRPLRFEIVSETL